MYVNLVLVLRWALNSPEKVCWSKFEVDLAFNLTRCKKGSIPPTIVFCANPAVSSGENSYLISAFTSSHFVPQRSG